MQLPPTRKLSDYFAGGKNLVTMSVSQNSAKGTREPGWRKELATMLDGEAIWSEELPLAEISSSPLASTRRRNRGDSFRCQAANLESQSL